jgi:Na+-translocating ferredoxin:NAD+ oxidoreductase RnfG subunit
MEIVVALIAALSAVVVAVIAKGTRNEARVGREENAAQHATVASVLSAHTQTCGTTYMASVSTLAA